MSYQSVCYQWKTSLIKGTVSRDFVVCFLVSFDRSEVYRHTERVRLLLKLRFRNEFLDFFRLGVVSLPCEWSWHLVPVRGSKERYFSIGFTLEI
jgi:hypothetical protein